MPTDINELNFSSAVTFLAEAVSSEGDGKELKVAIQADHIRSVLMAEWIRSGNQVGVHSKRLTDALRKDMLPVLEDERFEPINPKELEEDEESRNPLTVVHSLAQIGDIAGGKLGYWIPGPIRIVEIPSSDKALIVGGLPTIKLKEVIGIPLVSVGIGRMALSAALDGAKLKESDYWQSFDSWLGGEATELEHWTTKTIENLVSQMADSIEIEPRDLMVYVPEDILGKASSFTRWVAATDMGEVPKGPRLCRGPRTGTGEWPYFLAIFSGGKYGIKLTRSIQLEKPMFDQLRYGVDKQLKKPLPVDIFRTEGYFCLRLWRGLPEAESRVLAFGWHLANQSKDNYEDWCFPSDYFLLISQTLVRLGVPIVEKEWTERH